MAEAPIIPAQPATSSPGAPAASPAAAPAKPAGLEGKTEIDEKLTIECELLSYRAAGRVARKIADDVLSCAGPGDVTVLLLDEAGHAALHQQQAFALQVQLLQTDFDRVEPVPEVKKGLAPEAGREPAAQKGVLGIGAAVSAASALAGPVLDVLGLFRQDVVYRGRPTTVSQKALLLEVAGRLQAGTTDNRTVRVFFPRLVLFPPQEKEPASLKRVQETIEPLLQSRAAAEERLGELARELAREEQEVADRLKAAEGTEKEAGSPIEARIGEVVELRLRHEAARKLFDATEARHLAMWAALHAKDEKTGASGLRLLQEAEQMRALFQDRPGGKAFLVHAEVVAAGGSYKVVRNLWRTLFLGDGLRYSGGAAVAFGVFDGEGTLVRSGTHWWLEPHRRFEFSLGSHGPMRSFEPE